MFTRIFIIENRKLSRRVLLWVELALLLLSVAGVFALLAWVRQMLLRGITESGNLRVEGIDLAQAEAFLTWPTSFVLVLSVVFALGTFLIVILSGTVTAQEYGWRSFQLWLSRGVPRWQLPVAKFLAISVATLGFVTAAMALTALLGGAGSLLLAGSAAPSAVSWSHLGLAVLTTTLSLLPYAALAILLAVATRSAVAAVGGGLAFPLLLEPLATRVLPLLGERLATVADYLPGSLADGLVGAAAAAIVPGTGMESAAGPGPAPVSAALLLATYAALLLGAATLLFRRQDLGG